MRTLRRVLATAAALVALGPAACRDPAPSVQPLRVGLEGRYPPFEFKDDHGTLVGFDVDLARGLGTRLGRPVEFRDMQFDALIPEMQAGRIDMVCSGMSWLEERTKVVDFSAPYVRIRMAVLVSRERAATVKAIPDLDAAGVVVAVQRGTSGEAKARESFPKAEIRAFDTMVDASKEVAAGRAHAFVYDFVSVRELAAQEPERLRVLDGDLGAEVYCMAFPKGSPLVAEADAYLREASKPGGRIDSLLATWKPAAERAETK